MTNLASRSSLLGALTAVVVVAAGCPENPCSGEPGDICAFVGTGVSGLSDDGLPAVETELYLPMDITFGPDLPNGNKSLILISDNNFNSMGPQVNQVILMEFQLK